MNKYVIKNGSLVTPDQVNPQTMDVMIEGTRIKAIEKNIPADHADVIDATGLLVSAGLIDMHVHLREPGQEYKEDILTGTQAAAAGGFTSIACMPNTKPVVDNPATLRFLMSKIKSSAKVNVFPLGAITKSLDGKELSEMALMRDEGAVTFSDDGRWVQNSDVMKNALLYAKMLGVTLISHCEDPYLSEDGEMHEGYYSTILGLKGIPSQAEDIAVARDIILAAKYGPVHIAHISTRGSVELVRRAKRDGLSVTCETAPHYFFFTDEALSTYNTNLKMKPPLRAKDDRDAIIEGLMDGTIDAIATDHAPHSIDEKLCEFRQAAFGIIGLESAVGATLSVLYHQKKMPINQILQKLTTNPAKILQLDKGTLTVGKDADITIIDPKKKYTFNEKNIFSKSKNSPFLGIELKGKVVYTFVDGKIVYRETKAS